MNYVILPVVRARPATRPPRFKGADDLAMACTVKMLTRSTDLDQSI